MEAALLELLAAAAWAGIVPPDTLERVNERLGHVGKGQTNILRTGGPPLLILLGCIRESVQARELADRFLKGSRQVVLETGQGRVGHVDTDQVRRDTQPTYYRPPWSDREGLSTNSA